MALMQCLGILINDSICTYYFQDTSSISSNNQKQSEEGRKFVPNNIFDVIDHVSDDKSEPRSDLLTEGEVVTESRGGETTDMGTMCDQYQEKRDRIRCKVIACFRDSKLCFK